MHSPSDGIHCIELTPQAQTASASSAPVASIDSNNWRNESPNTGAVARVETHPDQLQPQAKYEVRTGVEIVDEGNIALANNNEPFTVIIP